MKKLFVLIMLLVFSLNAFADELSIWKLNTDSSRWDTTISQDNRLQYNFGESKYFYLAIERFGECPEYCGVNFDMAGVGFGKQIHLTKDLAFFAQVGFMYVRNNTGEQKQNENIQYYMINRFNGGNWKAFDSYRVDNSNALEAAVGLKMQIIDSVNLQFGYRTVTMWTNYVAYLNEDHTQMWHDPITVHDNSIFFSVGFDL